MAFITPRKKLAKQILKEAGKKGLKVDRDNIKSNFRFFANDTIYDFPLYPLIVTLSHIAGDRCLFFDLHDKNICKIIAKAMVKGALELEETVSKYTKEEQFHMKSREIFEKLVVKRCKKKFKKLAENYKARGEY